MIVVQRSNQWECKTMQMGSNRGLKDHCAVPMGGNTPRCKDVPSGYRTENPVDTAEGLAPLATSVADDG